MIKYDITLTILSFYIFGNVLPRDKFWEIFKTKMWA
jgi:hypothetical protein